MEVPVKNNQSLIDVAIEHLGSAEMALDIALLNGISLTDQLEPGTSLLLPEAKATTSVPVVATVTEASLLQLLTAHTAIMGGAVAGHVRNGGDVRIDSTGRMWVALLSDHADWANIDNKPLTFPPSVHFHTWLDINDKPLLFPPSAHAHSWPDIINKPTTFTPSAHVHFTNVESAESAGIINIDTNSRKVLTTTLTSANSITITPTAPTAMSEPCDAEIYFNTGATKPNVVFTAPSGYTFVWKIPMLADIKINAKYNFLFTVVNSSRIDVYWEAV